ncbi:thiamine diphosphokinase [Anaerovorax odorimutans]|uniref:Thiamine diphosphokinase n=1 Tax=Anaerovorax odorimutans TaxID=109327 RepID=A0ABT1RLF5_9FIRM|nr:thiamine diphosphokinase [Anaerovorax odorimutans]MCQ4636019.1 thiamine diphosphokinase [Anaerovorax odorimutans]
MKKCIIITSYIEGDLSNLICDEQPGFIICADGGYDHARKAGIVPDFLMGDFDSLTGRIQSGIEIVTFPSEKDDTDTGLCLQAALDLGYRDILIIGGIGGRFDHAFANIQLMSGIADKVDRIAIKDRKNYCTILRDGQLRLPKKEGQHVSLFSLSENCEGVTISGAKYPLNDYTLTRTFPLGVSNEYEEDHVRICVKNGTLLVVLSED